MARLKKKFSQKTIQRPDVILKTLFRVLRSFYAVLLDDLTMYRKRKSKNTPKECFIAKVDKLVSELFGENLLLKGTSLVKLSDSLSALIYPKSLS